MCKTQLINAANTASTAGQVGVQAGEKREIKGPPPWAGFGGFKAMGRQLLLLAPRAPALQLQSASLEQRQSLIVFCYLFSFS